MTRAQVAGFVATLVAAPLPGLLAPDRNYTWSLALFVLPCAAILFWFARTPREEIGRSRGAFALTLGVLVPMGVLLNLFFARFFFRYDAPEAVLGWSVPSVTLHGLDAAHPIPVEEFLFYGTGFLAMLLFYVWGREDFLRRYTPPVRHAEAGLPVLRLAVAPALAAAALLGLAWAWKALVRGESGFPGYLAYLLAIPFVVSLALYRVARPLVNWQAFVLVLLWVLGVSVLWEVSLAVPRGWWGYRREAMAGLYVGRWSDLPVEAVLVWFLAAFATVVVFEACRAFLHHPEARWRHRLLGRPAPRPDARPEAAA